MSTNQAIVLLFCGVVVVLAIWNLVLAIQNLKLEEYKKEEEKKDYYGRLK